MIVINTHHTDVTTVMQLSQDEISHLIQFLHTGQTLLLSMTCHTIYSCIESICKQQFPIVLSEPWSIVKALRMAKKCVVTRAEELDTMEQIIDQKQSVITSLQFGLNWHSEVGAEEVLSILRYGNAESNDVVVFECYQVDTANIFSFEESDGRFKDLPKLTRHIPAYFGFKIRELVLSSVSASIVDLFEIIASCPNLECLALENIEQDNADRVANHRHASWYTTNYDGISVISGSNVTHLKELMESGEVYYQLIQPETAKANDLLAINTKQKTAMKRQDALIYLGMDETLQEVEVKPGMKVNSEIFVKCHNSDKIIPDDSYVLYNAQKASPLVAVPVLQSLKKLSIRSILDYDSGEAHVLSLLQLAPNLEEFDYLHEYPPCDAFMDHLSVHCTKLKKIQFKGDDGATPCPNTITDAGFTKFLKAVPSMQEIEWDHCACITGQFFAQITEYGKNLRKIYIDRNGFEYGLTDVTEPIKFGSGVLPNLEQLRVVGCFEDTDFSTEFADTLIACAPDLRVLELPPYETINVPKLLASLTKLRSMSLTTQIYDSVKDANYMNEIVTQLSQCTQLQHLIICYSFTTELLKQCKWEDLKDLEFESRTIPENAEEWLLALNKACPRLESLKGLPTTVLSVLQGLLEDKEIFPHLHYDFRSQLTASKDMETAAETFIRQWLTESL
jgi:hypothetical protein